MRNKLVPFMLIDFRRQQAIDNPLFVAGRSRPSKEGGRCSEFIPIIVEDCELLVGVKAKFTCNLSSYCKVSSKYKFYNMAIMSSWH